MSEHADLAIAFARHMAWHAGAALALSAAVWTALGSWKPALLCFVASFYTDADHLFEYAMVHGLTVDLKSVFSGEYFLTVDRRFLWLHSWETLPVVWLWAWSRGQYRAATGFSLGFCGHLVIDQLSYPVRPLAYSLAYRWAHGFDAAAFGM